MNLGWGLTLVVCTCMLLTNLKTPNTLDLDCIHTPNNSPATHACPTPSHFYLAAKMIKKWTICESVVVVYCSLETNANPPPNKNKFSNFQIQLDYADNSRLKTIVGLYCFGSYWICLKFLEKFKQKFLSYFRFLPLLIPGLTDCEINTTSASACCQVSE